MAYLDVGCRVLIGLVFVVSAVTKWAAPREFTASLARMRVLPAGLTRPVAALVIAGETTVPVLLAFPRPTVVRLGWVLAAGLLAGFTVAIVASLRRGTAAPCRCFGRSTTPLGVRHVVRNLLLLGVVGLGLLAGTVGGSGHPGGAVVAAVAGAVVAGFVAMLDDLVALFAPQPGGVDRLAGRGQAPVRGGHQPSVHHRE